MKRLQVWKMKYWEEINYRKPKLRQLKWNHVAKTVQSDVLLYIFPFRSQLQIQSNRANFPLLFYNARSHTRMRKRDYRNIMRNWTERAYHTEKARICRIFDHYAMNFCIHWVSNGFLAGFSKKTRLLGVYWPTADEGGYHQNPFWDPTWPKRQFLAV